MAIRRHGTAGDRKKKQAENRKTYAAIRRKLKQDEDNLQKTAGIRKPEPAGIRKPEPAGIRKPEPAGIRKAELTGIRKAELTGI